MNIITEFKGKKIKCIHDISKTGLSGEEKKVNQDRDFIFHNFVSGFENIFMGVCDGWFIYSNISNEAKIADLEKVSSFFKLKLKITESKPRQ